jgi:hypothetical protein
VIDSLTHAIASEPERKDDFSRQFNAGSGQFFQRSKLHKSNPSTDKRAGLEEFEQPEIEDYYK